MTDPYGQQPGAYPPPGGYPPPQPPQGGYPPPPAGYPPAGGYPPPPPAGYPPTGYPPAGYPQPGYPASAPPAYPPAGYPASAPPGYPPGYPVAAPPPAPKKTGLIIGIVVAVLLLAGGGIAAYLLLKPNGPADVLEDYIIAIGKHDAATMVELSCGAFLEQSRQLAADPTQFDGAPTNARVVESSTVENGDSATVTFTVSYIRSDGTPRTDQGQKAFLQKIDGEWKVCDGS